MIRKVFLVLLALVLTLSVGLVACGGAGQEEEEEEEEQEEYLIDELEIEGPIEFPYFPYTMELDFSATQDELTLVFPENLGGVATTADLVGAIVMVVEETEVPDTVAVSVGSVDLWVPSIELTLDVDGDGELDYVETGIVNVSQRQSEDFTPFGAMELVTGNICLPCSIQAEMPLLSLMGEGPINLDVLATGQHNLQTGMLELTATGNVLTGLLSGLFFDMKWTKTELVRLAWERAVESYISNFDEEPTTLPECSKGRMFCTRSKISSKWKYSIAITPGGWDPNKWEEFKKTATGILADLNTLSNILQAYSIIPGLPVTVQPATGGPDPQTLINRIAGAVGQTQGYSVWIRLEGEVTYQYTVQQCREFEGELYWHTIDTWSVTKKEVKTIDTRETVQVDPGNAAATWTSVKAAMEKAREMATKEIADLEADC